MKFTLDEAQVKKVVNSNIDEATRVAKAAQPYFDEADALAKASNIKYIITIAEIVQGIVEKCQTLVKIVNEEKEITDAYCDRITKQMEDTSGLEGL